MRREAEEFLNLVRDAEDPTRADEARVQRALRVAIAAGVAPSVAASGGLEGSGFGELLSKLGLSGAKLELVAAGAALTLATGDAAMPPRTADAGRELAAAATTGATAPRAPAATAPLAPAPAEPLAAAPAEPFAPAPAEPLAPAPAEPLAPAAGRTPAAAEHRARFDPPRAALDRARPAPASPADALERAQPRRRAAAKRSAAPAAGSHLRAELDLLQRVQAALRRGDGASALHELEAHRTADSTLLAERRAARILALCQLGRIADARREAAVFAEQHPHSLQRAAVEGSCANR